jgi:TolB-like protein|tara:strand:+ start:8484 stop:9689 length:1206 start_codon:yes stop_codon:yes gene_type:complete
MEGPFPAYKGDEPYIFVSYAHVDADIVFPEMVQLSEQNFHVWYDDGIHPGAQWRQEIADAILHSSSFIYFVTPRSVVSQDCLKEVNFALDSRKRIIVIHLEDTKLPAGVQLALSDIQAILKYKLSTSSYHSKLQSVLRNETYAPQGDSASGSGFTANTLSIAVLPFVNMTNNAEQEYFCDGITEEIINGLVKFAQLKVIARTSSFEFKGKNTDIRVIGERLEVNHVLQGSVRTSGIRVRVTAQLVAVKDGTHVWSDRYDRDMIDVFDLQDEITAEILKALDIHLGVHKEKPKKTIDTEAYSSFLLGRYHSNRMEYDPAVAAYTEALSTEPDYADVHAGLAKVYEVLHNLSADLDYAGLCQEHMDEALSLDPHHPIARAIQLQRLYLTGQVNIPRPSRGLYV